jgi:hypothetical protein
VVVETLKDFGVVDLAVSELVFAGPVQAFILYFDKLIGFGAAYGALLGRSVAFVDISANHTSESLFHNRMF